ncbi:SPOR domain-containing protein [Salinibacter ruber]|uniref:SPOR domain-containing protein n=1 Tax=Salinibacter ruber TaxID=146919 RepID=UPI002072E9E8|nr:SPOR domain-containing protein [Salinibacter ruber]
MLPTQRPEIQFQEGEGLSLGPEEDPGADAEAERKGENEPEPTSADKAVPFAFSMGPYVAQVGAFSQLNRALRRAEQVRTVTDSVGITPYTTSTDTLYRVQAGPYPSASAASAALDGQTNFSVVARRVTGNERFVAQVGALGSWSRARKQAAQAAEQGFSVSIQPEMRQRQVTYRVQAGQYRNWSAAEEARAALGGQISGTARVLGTAGQGNYSVQVGAFTDLKQAQKQVRQLRGSDVPAYVHYKFPAPPYKVLVGRYTQRAPAERQENDLKSKFPGAFVLDLFAPSRD